MRTIGWAGAAVLAGIGFLTLAIGAGATILGMGAPISVASGSGGQVINAGLVADRQAAVTVAATAALAGAVLLATGILAGLLTEILDRLQSTPRLGVVVQRGDASAGLSRQDDPTAGRKAEEEVTGWLGPETRASAPLAQARPDPPPRSSAHPAAAQVPPRKTEAKVSGVLPLAAKPPTAKPPTAPPLPRAKPPF